jgi:hypothetical protein
MKTGSKNEALTNVERWRRAIGDGKTKTRFFSVQKYQFLTFSEAPGTQKTNKFAKTIIPANR